MAKKEVFNESNEALLIKFLQDETQEALKALGRGKEWMESLAVRAGVHEDGFPFLEVEVENDMVDTAMVNQKISFVGSKGPQTDQEALEYIKKHGLVQKTIALFFAINDLT